MNQITQAPQLDLLPETAPFSPEQRAWLNGFFAGFASPEGGMITALSPEQNAAVITGGDDGEAPWHDQTLALGARMELAQGRPLRRRMMAAMAQQDCGQCGYNCQDYSEAIASRKEARLNLCAPGGKETARMLKALAEEIGQGSVSSHARADPPPSRRPPRRLPGRSRDDPAQARFLSRRRLNKEGSAKETWHIEFDLAPSGLDYRPGDTFGVFAKNDLGLVDQIIAMLGASHITEVRGKTLREALQSDVSLGSAPDTLFDLFSFLTGGEKRAEGAPARARRGSGRRRRDARRARGAAEVFRRAAASRGFCRSARTIAAAPLLDLLFAQGRARQIVAHGRRCALCDRQAQAARRRVDLPRRAHRGGRNSCNVYVQAAHDFALSGESPNANRHGRPRNRRRSVPRLSAGARRGRAPGQKLAVLRSSASGA